MYGETTQYLCNFIEGETLSKKGSMLQNELPAIYQWNSVYKIPSDVLLQ